MKLLFPILFLLFLSPRHLQAQDSLPEISDETIDWKTLEASAGKFSRKDMVRFIIGIHNLGQLFGSEKNENYLDDFHFTDLNGDQLVDIIYSGIPESTHQPKTLIFSGSRDRSYPKKFEGPGILRRIQTGGTWLRLLTREEAGETQALTWVRKFTCDFDSSKVSLTAEVCFVKGTALPSYSDPSAEELGEAAALRISPEFAMDTPVDLTGDGKAEISGNISGIFPPGTPIIKMAAKTENDVTWVFGYVLGGAKQAAELFNEVKPGFTFIAGWVEDAKLK